MEVRELDDGDGGIGRAAAGRVAGMDRYARRCQQDLDLAVLLEAIDVLVACLGEPLVLEEGDDLGAEGLSSVVRILLF